MLPYPRQAHKVTQPGNAGSASIQGLETGFQQHLSYLPGVLRGLGISGNYSYTSSTTNGIPGRSDHPTLLRQTPNTWNISPTYDTKKFSMRLGMTCNGRVVNYTVPYPNLENRDNVRRGKPSNPIVSSMEFH